MFKYLLSFRPLLRLSKTSKFRSISSKSDQSENNEEKSIKKIERVEILQKYLKKLKFEKEEEKEEERKGPFKNYFQDEERNKRSIMYYEEYFDKNTKKKDRENFMVK